MNKKLFIFLFVIRQSSSSQVKVRSVPGIVPAGLDNMLTDVTSLEERVSRHACQVRVLQNYNRAIAAVLLLDLKVLNFVNFCSHDLTFVS